MPSVPDTIAPPSYSPSKKRQPHNPHPLTPVAQRAVEDEAYRLHLEEGRTIAQIAALQGIDPKTVGRRCARAEQRYLATRLVTVERVKHEQHERYLALLARTLPPGTSTITPKESQAVLAVLDRIDRLWGLDRSEPAPQVHQHVHATIAPPADRAQLRANLLGRAPEPQPLSESPPCVESDASEQALLAAPPSAVPQE